jgi:hypothetical protein
MASQPRCSTTTSVESKGSLPVNLRGADNSVHVNAQI